MQTPLSSSKHGKQRVERCQKKRVCEVQDPSVAEERGSHRPAPLLLQRAEKRLILLLTVPKLPSAHRLAEVTAWESFPGVPVARGQQKRPPATASPWPQLSPIHHCCQACRQDCSRRLVPALRAAPPNCQFLPTVFTPTEQK